MGKIRRIITNKKDNSVVFKIHDPKYKRLLAISVVINILLVVALAIGALNA